MNFGRNAAIQNIPMKNLSVISEEPSMLLVDEGDKLRNSHDSSLNHIENLMKPGVSLENYNF